MDRVRHARLGGGCGGLDKSEPQVDGAASSRGFEELLIEYYVFIQHGDHFTLSSPANCSLTFSF